MKILLTNEAGCFHPGIIALAKELSKYHRVCIVAPLQRMSGAGHSLTTSARPLHAKQWFVLDAVKIWSVDGTPCDCVALALDKLLLAKPDLIIAGIDLVNNRGNMIYTSGVVAAAMEGAIQGVRSLALSTTVKNEKKERCFRPVAKFVANNLNKLVADIPDFGTLNINFPAQFKAKKIIATKLTDGLLDNQYELETNPFGATFAWLKSPLREYNLDALQQKGDLYWLNQGYITVTPLQLDLLKSEAVTALQKVGIKL